MSYNGGSTGTSHGTSVFWGDYSPLTPTILPSPAPASDLMPSTWLDAIWRDAMEKRREAVWDAMADRIGDVAEEHPLTKGDVHFLSERSTDRSAPVFTITAALRTLGRICEDHPSRLREALPTFVAAIMDPNAAVRYAAAEAIWQARASAAIPHIQRAIEGERDEAVRHTLEHVHRILG